VALVLLILKCNLLSSTPRSWLLFATEDQDCLILFVGISISYILNSVNTIALSSIFSLEVIISVFGHTMYMYMYMYLFA
jgi:hypothetical protein